MLRHTLLRCATVAALLAWILSGSDSMAQGVPPKTLFVVTSADDSTNDGCDARHCNLREAIEAANRSARPVAIHFALPRGVSRIDVRAPLPPLRGQVVLDGSAQAGALCPLPGVQLDGALLPRSTPHTPVAEVDGLTLLGDYNTVRGLAITNFTGHGIVVRGSYNTLQCLFVGVDLSGLHAAGNARHGIVVESGMLNQVGGATRALGNLISANGGIGLRLKQALGTSEQFNGIGVDILARPTLPNGNDAPEADLPPPPPSSLPPAELQRLAQQVEQYVRQVSTPYDDASTLALFNKYVALLGPNLPVRPANLRELAQLLYVRPPLAQAFSRELSTLVTQAQHQAVLQLYQARQGFSRSPSFLNEVAPFNGPRPLAEQLPTLDPDDVTVNGPPSTTRAVRIADPDLPIYPLFPSPFTFLFLRTSGPTSFLGDPYEEIDLACEGAAPSCTWPVVYDLRPRVIDLVFETDEFSAAQVADILAEDGYFFGLYLNGQLLSRKTPTDPYGYTAARLPNAECLNLTPCVVFEIQAQNKLQSIPLPWKFELRVEQLQDLAVPQIIGADEFGNPIVVTQEAVIINRTFKTFNPNSTNSASWFVTAMEETFRSDRCIDCHSFGTPEALTAHHADHNISLPSPITLVPSLFVPGAHVMTCSNCHSLPLTNDSGTPFHEIEWRAPYFDLDLDWSTKTASQICARVKANLPTQALRHLHFHGDARLFWAVADPNHPYEIVPKPAAFPQNYDEFLRRFDVWNAGGAPCP